MPTHSLPKEGEFMKRSVLIVDDSTTSRLIIQRCCQIAGWADAEFAHASDGKMALEAIHSRPFDLVLSDYNMPVIDGLELALSLFNEHFLPGIAVAIITSGKNDILTSKLLELGVMEVLAKPITPQDLSRLLERLD